MLWNIRAYNSLSTLLGNLSLFIFTLDSIPYTKAWLQYPSDGIATMTHYTLPENYIASCGCTAASTHFPTAALSQQAYGSSTAYGPGCGRCFKLTLLNTFLSDPPFFPDVAKSIVVKITDLCPAPGGTWCSATASQPNEGGSFLNFDLAWPSPAIPDDFFPSNASFYGYTDFGVWNISYESVSCLQDWAGSKQRAALGSVDDGSSACCPADPTGNPNNTCPSFSDNAGVVP
ncbi:RlpA-like double-psi beta-barrel-protein domain-containing protein-containing protein [Abortiporus biennis]|nr:RlpA-like double-psi beta-barrel-protein domain-containing protein-containing protein [Abortiporus biennis]